MLLRTLLLAALLATSARGAEPKVGFKVEDFSLKDVTGQTHSLAGCKEKKAVVLLFLGTQCPINNAYLPLLAELHRSYADRGVQFFALNANRHDTPQDIADHAKKYEIPFPVLKDTGNVIADRVMAERTPEAIVLDGARKVVYRGRIDDRYGYKHRRDKASRHDLAIALDEVLAGKSVSVPVTEVEGCYIARVKETKADGKITYTKHIAPLLQKNCQECHRPGQIGPMPLLSYEDTVNWSDTIREVVAQKRMPPWHADPQHGKFTNERRLSKEEIQNLTAWLDNGMPRGDEKDQPKPLQFTEGWRIGKPDVVFQMKDEYVVPPKTERGAIRYQYFRVPTNFQEDMWIQAAEARPGNYKVVHHILVYVRVPGVGRSRGPDGIGSGLLVAFAPGDMPAILPEGSAKKIPKGAELFFQMHYTPVATREKDRSAVGLIFSKKPPQNEVRTRAIAQQVLVIPPDAENHKVTSTTRLREDSLLLSLLPHMHLRGKSFEYVATYPGGKQETLLKVPEYNFNWQTVYRLEKPLRLPAGTRIDCTAYFDNSSKNRNNPDPSKYVAWGDQTWQEMMIGFIDYVILPDDNKR
jgi:peroxiredoxin